MQQHPPFQTRINAIAHPAFGGRSHRYLESFRDLDLASREQGESHNPLIANLRLQHLYPSLLSKGQWQSLFDNLGHYRKFRQTDNNQTMVLRDHDLILLALYCVAYPTATSAEINASILRQLWQSQFPILFSQPNHKM